MLPVFFSLMGVALNAATLVSSLGTSCSAPLGAGTAAATDPFWMENIKHQGISAFNPDPSTYQVFRNVKDFGAKGDGVTDDTAAINSAISLGDRCTGGAATCNSSSIAPAVVYFPQGTYLVSDAIIALYYTQLIGDATSPPTLLASPGFQGAAVIDADPYIPGGNGAQFYVNQNNFFRSVRNFVIDITQVPASSTLGVGIHWQVSQSTSLMNIVFDMSTEPGTAHQGIHMENGSGGFMGDMIFNGGAYGLFLGNQQFTVRNITVNNAAVAAVGAIWDWGWTFQRVTINNCPIGFDLTTGSTSTAQAVSAEAIIDATVNNVPQFIVTSTDSNGNLIGAGSLVLNNIHLSNVPTAVATADGAVVLAGSTGSTTIASWAQGNVYSGSSATGTFTQGTVSSLSNSVLLDSAGNIFGRGHPQYSTYAVSQFVSVRDQGAKGDGSTDDTAALQAVFDTYAGCKIIFFDAGTYVVTSTLKIPAGTQMVGEAWSVIAARGAAFQDMNNPQVVVQVGETGSSGILEISDILFSTIGPTGGAIIVEWNVKGSSQGAAGMWDSHIRLGGTAGTNLQLPDCPADGSGGTANCLAAFLSLHLTASSSAYLEGTWVWTSDHDMDITGVEQISIFTGRGILSESAGPVWMIGTASEHAAIYQYSLVGAQNHYMGLIQTETPYYQPTPAAPAPFTLSSTYSDPTVTSSALGLSIHSSSDILIFGAGLYSFYSSYDQTCLTTNTCQSQILDIDSTSSSIFIYSLSTIGTTFQLSYKEQGIINQDSNENGLASTVTAWTISS